MSDLSVGEDVILVAVQSATGNVSAKIGMLMNPNARKRMAEPRAIRRFVASGVGIQSTRIFSRRSDLTFPTVRGLTPVSTAKSLLCHGHILPRAYNPKRRGLKGPPDQTIQGSGCASPVRHSGLGSAVRAFGTGLVSRGISTTVFWLAHCQASEGRSESPGGG